MNIAYGLTKALRDSFQAQLDELDGDIKKAEEEFAPFSAYSEWYEDRKYLIAEIEAANTRMQKSQTPEPQLHA